MLVPLEPPLPDDSTLQSGTKPTRHETDTHRPGIYTRHRLDHEERSSSVGQPAWYVPAYLVMRNSWFPAHCEGLRALLAMLLSRSSSA